MNSNKETCLKVFGLILIAVIPTLCIYLLLEKFVGQAKLEGQALGYTISFAGPIAFYAFILILFYKWAVNQIPTKKQTISNQEELESMSDYNKIILVEEIKGEISILDAQLKYLNSLIYKRDISGLPKITQIQVDESKIR